MEERIGTMSLTSTIFLVSYSFQDCLLPLLPSCVFVHTQANYNGCSLWSL